MVYGASITVDTITSRDGIGYFLTTAALAVVPVRFSLVLGAVAVAGIRVRLRVVQLESGRVGFRIRIVLAARAVVTVAVIASVAIAVAIVHVGFSRNGLALGDVYT